MRVALVIALLVSSAEAQQNLSACTPEAENDWDRTFAWTHGISIIDPATHIGPPIADRKFENPLLNVISEGFFPVDGTKQLACGVLTKWTMFRGPGSELDLHPHVTLGDPFRHITAGLPPFGRDAGCEGCIWGEVTPPESLQWFWATKGGSLGGQTNACGPKEPACSVDAFANDTFCMYGPWVMERWYQFRAEIHPAEAFWGKRGATVRVVVVTDRSNRFDTRNDYRRLKTQPANWIPWSALPRTLDVIATLRVPSGSKREIAIREIDGQGAPRDATASVPIAAGSAQALIRHSAGVSISSLPACRTSTGDSQISVRLATSLTTGTPARAYDIEGLNPAPRPAVAVAQAATAEAPPDEQARENEVVPRIEVVGTEWELIGPRLSVQTPIANSRLEWGLEGIDSLRWRIAGEQRLRLRLRADPQSSSRLHVDLLLMAVNIETGERIDIAPSSQTVFVDIGHGSRVAPSVAGNTASVHQHRVTAADELSIFVKFPREQRLPDGTARTRSIRVTVNAVVRDPSRSADAVDFTYDFKNVIPDLAAAVQDSDRWKTGEIPDLLISALVGLARNEGCSISRQRLESHWGPPDASRPAQVSRHAERVARTMRMSVIWFLEDGTLQTEEVRQLRTLARMYAAEACS